jgi:hypothetical protein
MPENTLEREREGHTDVIGEDTAIGETTCWFTGKGDTIGIFPRGPRFSGVACVSI